MHAHNLTHGYNAMLLLMLGYRVDSREDTVEASAGVVEVVWEVEEEWVVVEAVVCREVVVMEV